jgi:hypothetical protein
VQCTVCGAVHSAVRSQCGEFFASPESALVGGVCATAGRQRGWGHGRHRGYCSTLSCCRAVDRCSEADHLEEVEADANQSDEGFEDEGAEALTTHVNEKKNAVIVINASGSIQIANKVCTGCPSTSRSPAGMCTEPHVQASRVCADELDFPNNDVLLCAPAMPAPVLLQQCCN